MIVIQATDGPFVVAVIVTALDGIIRGLEAHKLREEQVSLLIDFLIDLSFIFGNILFLDSMRRKNVGRVRVGIVANGAFAVALSVLLVAGIIIRFNQHWTVIARITWAVRLLAVLFFVAAPAFYSGLWHVHGSPLTSPLRILSATTAAKLGAASAAILVWSLLLSIALLSDPDIIWSAVAA